MFASLFSHELTPRPPLYEVERGKGGEFMRVREEGRGGKFRNKRKNSEWIFLELTK